MPTWAWIPIGVVVVVLVGLAAWALSARRRSLRLRRRFGSEYDRAVDRSPSRRQAEAELADRERRREALRIRPLSREAREQYAARWQQVQADFVDSPAAAVTEAEVLVSDVMRDRGYPMDDFEQRAADVSVDHADVVESYREGHRLSELSARGEASTEDLRQAMQHYRRLSDELLGTSGRGGDGDGRDGSGDSARDREELATQRGREQRQRERTRGR
jgi:hypothetical protein